MICSTSFYLLYLQVIRMGFEPMTHSLEGCCSIQLSYRTDLLSKIASAKLQKKNGLCKFLLIFLLFRNMKNVAGEALFAE